MITSEEPKQLGSVGFTSDALVPFVYICYTLGCFGRNFVICNCTMYSALANKLQHTNTVINAQYYKARLETFQANQVEADTLRAQA